MSTYRLEDITEVFAWTGSTPEQAGVPQEAVTDNGISVCGLLGDCEVNGVCMIAYDTGIITGISIYGDTKDLKAIMNALYEKYGSPYASGSLPYIPMKGGAAYWHRFYTGKGTAELSAVPEGKEFTLEYQNGEKPAEILKREAGMTLTELGQAAGYYMKPEEGFFQELMIREEGKKEQAPENFFSNTGMMGSMQTPSSGQPARFRLTYRHRNDLYEALICKNSPEICEQYLTEAGHTWKSGKAEHDEWIFDGSLLIWKNPLQDVWVLSMPEGAEEEKLFEMKDHLERLWNS